MSAAAEGGAAAAPATGGFDARTVATVQKLPLLSETAGPRDAKEKWEARLKQELQALIQYIQANKAADSDWFTIAPEPAPASGSRSGSSGSSGSSTSGLRWAGKCWYVHNYVRHEFAFRFDVPATYPLVAPEIEIPELEGKTAKMYRGGKICLTIHFKPLWARNAPHFGFAHALCLGLAPWLAAEVPFLVDSGAIVSKT